MSRVAVVFGETGTGKSTLALSFPKPLVHFELDIGGFDRAAGRYKKEISNGEITTKSYCWPISALEMELGLVKRTSTGDMKKLWQEVGRDFVEIIKAQKVKTIVIDTFSQFWDLDQMAFFEEVQEGSEKSRARMSQIEYTEPNTRMRTVIYYAKRMDINLVLVCHATDVWKKRPLPNGKTEDYTDGIKPEGWKHVGKEADYILQTYIVSEEKKDNKGKKTLVHTPHAVVTKSAVGLDLVGWVFANPTWDELESIIQVMKEGE